MFLKTKKISDYETYNDNPTHKEGLKEKTKLEIVDKGVLIDPNTNEYWIAVKKEKGENYLADTLEYRKVYVNSLDKIKSLSNPALKIWCYILKNISPCKDYVIINIEGVLEFTGYRGKSNVYLGIIELLDKGVIFRSNGNGTYFINVNYFFNGRRI